MQGLKNWTTRLLPQIEKAKATNNIRFMNQLGDKLLKYIQNALDRNKENKAATKAIKEMEWSLRAFLSQEIEESGAVEIGKDTEGIRIQNKQEEENGQSDTNNGDSSNVYVYENEIPRGLRKGEECIRIHERESGEALEEECEGGREEEDVYIEEEGGVLRGSSLGKSSQVDRDVFSPTAPNLTSPFNPLEFLDSIYLPSSQSSHSNGLGITEPIDPQFPHEGMADIPLSPPALKKSSDAKTTLDKTKSLLYKLEQFKKRLEEEE